MFSIKFLPSQLARETTISTEMSQNAIIEVHEVLCMPQNTKMIDFSIYELPSQCFFLICFAPQDLQNHMNRLGNNTKQDQQVKQLINHHFEGVRF